jgi:hypothetical protein
MGESAHVAAAPMGPESKAAIRRNIVPVSFRQKKTPPCGGDFSGCLVELNRIELSAS